MQIQKITNTPFDGKVISTPALEKFKSTLNNVNTFEKELQMIEKVKDGKIFYYDTYKKENLPFGLKSEKIYAKICEKLGFKKGHSKVLWSAPVEFSTELFNRLISIYRKKYFNVELTNSL